MVPITIKQMTAGRKTMRKTMIIIQTMKIMKIIHTMVIIDLKETTDKAMIDHVMEITEATVSENGRATGIGTIGEIEMIMAKLKIMAIEETDQEETEMTIGMEEVVVMVEKGMTMIMVIPKREDVEEMVILEMTMKSNQRRERFIFRRNNLMMKSHYLETMYRWE